ncbi:MAG: hypothetical protein JNN03_03280 [Rubrivivax sp.]|nr:hypothetical protein [Rubrivivax sp.]
MTPFSYADAPTPVRADIGAAHRRYWHTLSRPGSWWTGAERVAIARESRLAVDCALCRARKAALSPHAVPGTHDHGPGLPAAAVDAVHRVVTDQSRITLRYVDDNAAQGLLSKEAYVELVGVVVAVFSIDEFHRALGLPLEPLPAPQPGEPSRYRPAVLSEDIGFVPTVPREGAVGPEADLFKHTRAANVVRALTLVPDALRDWRELSAAQYLSFAGMANYVKDPERAIDRLQMELVAGRVSAVNECFY